MRADGLSGGAVWYDYHVRHPDRLNWTVALAAKHAGARLANYVEAVGPLGEGGRVNGARVKDLETGREHDIEAGMTLLAAGSQLPELRTRFDAAGAPPLLRAMNLLVNRPARDIATVAAGTMTTAEAVGPLRYGTVDRELEVSPARRRT